MVDLEEILEQELDKFYTIEFNQLIDVVRKDIQVEIIDNSVFGPISGRFNFLEQMIWVNKDLPKKSMFFTLIHEYGHFLTFRDYITKFGVDPFKYGADIRRRELGAYFHGWKFIKNNSVKISKNDWREFHLEMLDEYGV